ncbi:TetR/AcrR family transcriptional regulator [Nevskia ramosa]|uniref:TetR/AcrR family transcriptional regulator n=1 Tax=Nevskia ramosa TaxID=64002 RepID=UPI002355A4B5|nr:TetR/AcrR family transcriptional regulator [Nevskia ramosa]
MAKPATRKTATRLSIDDRTADILNAARQIISEKGYEKILLADIARQAGIVEGTIYRYFQNKRDLLVKVAELWFGEQLTADSHLDGISGTQNKLRHVAWRTLSIIKREPVLSRFMLMELRPDPNYRSTPFFELNRHFTRETLQICKDAIASGEFHADVSPTLMRDMLHGCIEHRTWAFLRGEGDFSPDEVAEGIATVVYRGMLAHPVPSQPAAALETLVSRLEKVAERLEQKPPQAGRGNQLR